LRAVVAELVEGCAAVLGVFTVVKITE